jgi:MarR family transcriptional regulator, lower aerobic nicotinate degradation pathway regulator
VDHLPSWLLARTAADSRRIVSDRFAEAGARGYHYRLLTSLIEDGPASQAALGRRTDIHLSDMVAALNELEEGGYVSREPDPADRRRNVITVTEAGRRRAEELGAVVRSIQEELLGPLDPDERAQLTTLLQKLAAHHRQGIPPLSENW